MRLTAAALVLGILVSGCATNMETSPSPTSTTLDAASFKCATAKSYRPANITVAIETTKGTIEAVLYGARAPITVCNFLRYVEEDFYDNTIWHRICPHVIQTGGFGPYTPPNGYQKPTHEPIKNEANVSMLRNYKGTLGMASNLNASDPRTFDTADAQFYINNADHRYLDWDGKYPPGYAVFGNVTKGWEVEQTINATRTVPDAPNSGCNGVPVPSQQTTITDIRVLSG